MSDELTITEAALLIQPVPPPQIPFRKMRLYQAGNRPGIYARRVLLLYSGAYLSTAGLIYISLGNDYAVPLALGNTAPGTSGNILLHNSDSVPVQLSEFQLNLPAGVTLTAGNIAIHAVEF